MGGEARFHGGTPPDPHARHTSPQILMTALGLRASAFAVPCQDCPERARELQPSLSGTPTQCDHWAPGPLLPSPGCLLALLGVSAHSRPHLPGPISSFLTVHPPDCTPRAAAPSLRLAPSGRMGVGVPGAGPPPSPAVGATQAPEVAFGNHQSIARYPQARRRVTGQGGLEEAPGPAHTAHC